MTLRKLPGAAGLGLLAFLAAHAATFGGDHEVGGTYHGVVQIAALGAVVGFAMAALAVACAVRDTWAEGSVLAHRLGGLLPGLPATLAASALWYSLVERSEAAHSGPALPIVLGMLVIAAWLVRIAAAAILHFIGAIAIAIARPRFATRAVAWIARAHAVVRALSEPARTRRFARPPPGSMHVACI